MQPGERIADRFEVDRMVGEGGMGEIYLARDTVTDQRVALKVMRGASRQEQERLGAEARVLAELEHPSIVRYVAHGITPEGQWYLAMEWLEGEDLWQRLSRERLSVRESVVVAHRAAEALGYAHSRGVVHRDVKPRNLFLLGGRADDLRLLDFGIARRDLSTRTRTRPGVMMGTPGYMAAEQAHGETDIDARADVFSLGCVLYECVTGEPAFAADTLLALLAKILLQEPPRLAEIAAVPASLDELCARMMSKEREGRPRDGAEAAAKLRALLEQEDFDRAAAGAPKVRPRSLTRAERSLVAVVLARPAESEIITGPGSTVRSIAAHGDIVARIAALGGRLDSLAGGAVLVSIQGADAATDLATRAARCALAMRAALGQAQVALAMGRAELGASAPVGEVIERVARLLEIPDSRPTVRLDEVTAGLLGTRFDVSRDELGAALHGEVDHGERTLLGKRSPLVGRDREMRLLDGIYEECVNEPVARAVLVTAAAGVGKSRLRHDWLQQLVLMHPKPPSVWLARGDPMSVGASLGLVSQQIRRELGVQLGTDEGVQRTAIQARMAESVPAERRNDVAAFLGELIGVRFPDGGSFPLQTARRDAILRGDQMRRAWEDFLESELALGPIVMVVEDLHWGDAGSVSYIDGALRLYRDKPLMVLALARPDVTTVFPDLWKGRGIDHVELRDLSRVASERLVRATLGKQATSEAVTRLVTRAAGNAFYLEQLVRAEAEGRAEVPGTVMAMVQARLETFDAETRRVLRAASVFGEVFWDGAVRNLLGGSRETRLVRESLEDLVLREVIARLPRPRFPGQEEYAFRHGLMRDAAYGMLTDADRVVGHQLAGLWLEEAGETDAATVAEHLERGGERARAVGWWARAAQAALEANEFAQAVALAARGEQCGAESETLAELWLVQTEAHGWAGAWREAGAKASAAMALVTAGSAVWYRAAAQAVRTQARLGGNDQVEAIVMEIERTAAVPGAEGERVNALAVATPYAFHRGRVELVRRMMREFDDAPPEIAGDPVIAPRIEVARGMLALFAGEVEVYAVSRKAIVDLYAATGDRRQECGARVNLGFAYSELGLWDQAEEALRPALADAARMGLEIVRSVAAHNLGLVVARRAPDEARSLAELALEAGAKQRDPRLEGGARTYLSIIAAMAGDLPTAEREARAAIGVLGSLPPARAFALGVLASHLIALGRAEDALVAAREASSILGDLGGIEAGEACIRLAFAEALAATGDVSAAREQIIAARDRLLARADKIVRTAWREAFLAIPEHARTLELARDWADG